MDGLFTTVDVQVHVTCRVCPDVVLHAVLMADHVAEFVAVGKDLCASSSCVLFDPHSESVFSILLVVLEEHVVLLGVVAKDWSLAVNTGKMDSVAEVLFIIGLIIQCAKVCPMRPSRIVLILGLTPSNVKAVAIPSLGAAAGVGENVGLTIFSDPYPIITALLIH